MQGLEVHTKEFGFYGVENDESLELVTQNTCFWKESKSNKARQNQSFWSQFLLSVLKS